jgi:outer membrane protein OmpA-like peptidoglycan-associated protein
MSDRTTFDSSILLPLPAPGLEGPSRSDAEASSLAKPAPAKKARRPRPTFDDGALTRTFKFPSKAYPRSSYYVTSTEIIIRIKKARKKWKLIVPKKRVVSYRTNRWFAKPRWVAIELTYTQAAKLGLAEARMPNAMPEIVTSNTASSGQYEIACADTACAVPSPVGPEAPGGGNVAEFQNDLADQIDDLSELECTNDFRLTADQDEPEAEESLPQQSPLVSHGEATSTDDDDVRVVPVVAQRQQPMVAPRWSFRHAIAALAAAITGFAIWAAFDATSLNPSPECALAEPAAHCANPIVTGSIDPSSAPQLLASAPIEDLPLSVAQTAALARAELAAQNIAASVPLAPADEKPDTASFANTIRDARAVLSGHDIELPAPAFTSAVFTPQPTASALAECDSLSATGRHILITFDYAHSHLNRAVLAVLEDFAAKLRACPASNVTIEGHTDSDGRADRNRTLSLRRAQAVKKHLAAAGVDPRQLATIGFGQTRPTVPNVSQKNKRNNRRAALVVTTQR